MYEHPVLIYIPPFGELRGGAWVVLDPTINSERMEMYCDSQGRGGVLEPSGTVEIKFRARDVLSTMHRLDDKLKELEKKLDEENDEHQQQVFKAQIASREEELFPVYQQIALQFADLHDTPGRMKAKDVIHAVVDWKRARPFFYHRLRRLLAEDKLREQLKAQRPSTSHEEATQILKKSAAPEVWNDDNQVRNGSTLPVSSRKYVGQPASPIYPFSTPRTLPTRCQSL